MKWMDKAACRGAEPLVFHPDIERGESGEAPWVKARSFCAVCTVKMECLEYCLEYEARVFRRNGMYAGMTPRERDVFVKNRR